MRFDTTLFHHAGEPCDRGRLFLGLLAEEAMPRLAEPGSVSGSSPLPEPAEQDA